MKSALRIVIVLVVLAVIGKMLTPSPPKITAELLAQEMQKRVSLPMDLGDGFRLDSIVASGNDVVSTVTVSQLPAGPADTALRRTLEQAAISDACREIAPIKAEYVKTGIRIVKVFNNDKGGEIVTAVVDPASCP
jgi:hypothetical protein